MTTMDTMLKKDGTLKLMYQKVKDELLKRKAEGTVRVHARRLSGQTENGLRILFDRQDLYTQFAEAFGLDYKLGNDAPRGGIEGDYIDITLNDTFLKFWEVEANE